MQENKALNLLSLARKGGRIEVGEEPVGYTARSGHARLVVVASDASDHTFRRAKSYVAGTSQQLVTLPYSKEQLGAALGRSSCAMAAVTDAALALAFVKALDDDRLETVRQALEDKSNRLRRRQQEAQAHKNNVRHGKK